MSRGCPKAVCVASELQDLIEGQISKRGIGSGVSLPKGVFEIDDTLTIASVRGLRFGGQSPWATELRWVGPADRPMFDIDRSEDILLEHFSITVGAGKKLLAAAWIENGKGRTGPKAAPGAQSTHVSWNNVRVVGDGNLIGGFHVKLFDVEGHQERPSFIRSRHGDRLHRHGLHLGRTEREESGLRPL